MKAEIAYQLIQAHKNSETHEREQFDIWRRWYKSEWAAERKHSSDAYVSSSTGDDSDVSMETNYPYAFVDALISNISPSNPQVTCISPDPAEESVRFVRNQQRLINWVLMKDKTHRHCWKTNSRASLYGRVGLRGFWDAKRERPRFGVVDPRNYWFDRASEDWEDIEYLILVDVISERQFKRKARLGRYSRKAQETMKFESYPTWIRSDNDGLPENLRNNPQLKWAVTYKFYDLVDDVYYLFADGVNTPLKKGPLPYRLIKNPMYQHAFNDNLTDSAGLSDIKLIQSALERLNEIDNLELWHAQTSIPTITMNSGLVKDPDSVSAAYQSISGPNELLKIHTNQQMRLTDVFGTLPMPQATPAWEHMRSRCQQIIEYVLALPQYQRGVVGNADIATEVALADTATRTRNARRLKAVYDMIEWMAMAILAFYEEYLPPDKDIWVRLPGEPEGQRLNRQALGFREFTSQDPLHANYQKGSKKGDLIGRRPFEIDIEVVAFSGPENNRLLQLQNLAKFMEVLMQAPNVSQERLFRKLAELLEVADILLTDEEKAKMEQQQAQAQAAQAQMPPPGGGGAEQIVPGSVNGADNISTGALPAGTEIPAMPGNAAGGAGINGGLI